jgi:hypothetical protein
MGAQPRRAGLARLELGVRARGGRRKVACAELHRRGAGASAVRAAQRTALDADRARPRARQCHARIAAHSHQHFGEEAEASPGAVTITSQAFSASSQARLRAGWPAACTRADPETATTCPTVPSPTQTAGA